MLNFLLASGASAAIASSIVSLSGGGDVLPTASLNLSLTGLVPTASYTISCNIESNYPFQFVMFGSNFSGNTSSISSYSLNGKQVTQGQLNIGLNTAVIVGTFTNPSTDSLVFTNLDQANTFNISSCTAVPIQG